MHENSVYDCVIVGGGPGGLTCAIFLGRYRRRVLLIDSGQPRNYAARGIHGFLGQHDIEPAALLGKGRREAEMVGVAILDARVTAARRSGDVFEVDAGQQRFRTRRIVLAYGVRDLLPSIEGLEQWYGRGVHHCPDCDAFEYRDRRIVVVGQGRRAAALCLKLLQWTTEVTLLTHGEQPTMPAEDRSKLEATGVTICTERILRLEGESGSLRRCTFESGAPLDVEALFFSIGTSRSSDLAEQLGCAIGDDDVDIRVDDHRRTTVEGVWAVGDLVEGSKLVVTAAADGAIAAIDINSSLLPPARRVK